VRTLIIVSSLFVLAYFGLGYIKEKNPSFGPKPENVAKERVDFILKTMVAHGAGTNTEIQTAMCRWYKDKIFLGDRDEQAAASDGFDHWTREIDAYSGIHSYEIVSIDPGKAGDPENTEYVTVKIDGGRHVLRVPPQQQISWVSL
jgi:hypothetical protein